MQWYARQVANNPCSVILLVLAAAVGCAIICISLNELPDFKDPLLGFEPRGTILSARNTAWQNLLKSTIWNGPLAFYPGNIVTDITNETLETDELRKTSQNKVPGFNKSEDFDEALGPWLELETEDKNYGSLHNEEDEDDMGRVVFERTSQDLKPSKGIFVERKDFFCHKLGRQYAHIIIKSVSGHNLFTVEGLKAICDLDQNKLRKSEHFTNLCEVTSWNSCCHSWSISNYVSLLQNLTSCQDIQVSDITAVTQLLVTCAPFYHGMKLSHDCARDLALCRSVPRQCIEYDAVYNILHYLVDTNFLNPDSPNFLV